MIHPSTRKLIDRLHERTLEDRVGWTEGDDGAIQYATSDYRLIVFAETNEMKLLDADDRELEYVDQSELAEMANDNGVGYTDIASELFVEGLRIAKGTKRAIDTIMAGLEALNADEDKIAA